MDVKNILSKCDHTLLGQTATWEQIKKICDDGMKYQTASVCIPPCYVKQAKEYVGNKLAICTVIGFPNGYNTTAVKVFETKDAIAGGADEIRRIAARLDEGRLHQPGDLAAENFNLQFFFLFASVNSQNTV